MSNNNNNNIVLAERQDTMPLMSWSRVRLGQPTFQLPRNPMAYLEYILNIVIFKYKQFSIFITFGGYKGL